MPAATSPPEHLRQEVQSVLISEAEIARRVRELATEIERDYTDKELLMVALLTGTVPFLADLMRHVTLPLRLDFMGVSSYGDGTAPGELVFTKELRLEARDRDVLLVDDILIPAKPSMPCLKINRPATTQPQDLCYWRKPRRRESVTLTMSASRCLMNLSSATAWTTPNAIAICRSSACSNPKCTHDRHCSILVLLQGSHPMRLNLTGTP